MYVSDKGNLILTPIDLNPDNCKSMGWEEDPRLGIMAFTRVGRRLEEPTFHHFTRSVNISAWFALQFGAEVKYIDGEAREIINVSGEPFCGLM